MSIANLRAPKTRALVLKTAISAEVKSGLNNTTFCTIDRLPKNVSVRTLLKRMFHKFQSAQLTMGNEMETI